MTLSQRLLRDLLREVPPDGETYFHGIVRTPDAIALKPDPEAYEVLKPGLQALELRFARPRDLEAPELRGPVRARRAGAGPDDPAGGAGPAAPAPPRPRRKRSSTTSPSSSSPI